MAFRSGILRRCRFGMLFLFFIAACAPVKESYRYLDEGENHVVRLEKAGAAASYSHPAVLDQAVLEKALGSIVVSHPVPLLKRIFIQKSEIIGPAFIPEEAALLAGRFKAAAERATPEEHIAFLLASGKNHISTEITSGIAFLKEGELHLIFANHRTPLSTQRHPQIPRDTMLRSYEQDGFQLIVQPHQTKMGDGLLERGQEGISIDYAAVGREASAALNENGTLEEASLGSLKLEERFQLLKKLREESLITEEEYTEKKKDLLKRLDIK